MRAEIIVPVLFAVLGVAAIVYFVYIKKQNAHPVITYPAAPPGSTTGWTIAWSANMPAQMTNNGDGTYSFAFPSTDGVHYVYKAGSPMSVGQKITMQFSLSGSGKIVPTASSGSGSAAVRLFIQQTGDNMSGLGPYEFYRWWSNPANVALTANGDFTLEVLLNPDQWSSVMGKNGSQAPGPFSLALANCGNIGFTFGAEFFGHGVYATGGPATFTLKSYTIA